MNDTSPLRASNALLKTAIELVEDSITLLEGTAPSRSQALKRLADDLEEILRTEGEADE